MKNIILLIWLSLASLTAFSQGFNTDFGKNRVQTKNFDWRFYKSDKFDVYYYVGGKNLARYVLSEADKNIKEIESFFDFRLEEKISFIVYNSQSDYNQSNMFLERDFLNIGGTTKIIGNTAFVFYEDNHVEFLHNIREGIAEVVLNEMLYGGTIQERVQNATLLHLPEWYTKGLVKHISGSWNLTKESILRNGILSGDFKKMGNLSNDEKILVSHSLWEYIQKKYGKEAVANIVYVARINKNLESGFTFVIGKTLAETYEEWFNYLYYKYLDQQADFELLENEIDLKRRINRKKLITEFEVSPDGKYMCFATNKLGKIKVWLYDLETKNVQRIYKEGFKSEVKSIDVSYPLIKWSKTKNELFLISEKRGQPFVWIYEPEKSKFTEKFPLFRIDKIYSFNISPDNRNIVLSGLEKGQSDIFLLDRQSKFVRPLTNDDYDDHDADFIDDGSKIIFSSNRSSTNLRSLKGDNFDFSPSFDLYVLNHKKRATELQKITSTPLTNESKPKQLNDEFIIYRSDYNKHYNLNILKREKLYNGVRAIIVKQNSLIASDDTLLFENKIQYSEYLKSLTSKDSVNLSRIDTTSLFADTTYAYRLTNFGENIIRYHYKIDSNQIWFMAYSNQKYKVFKWNLPENLTAKPFIEIEEEYKVVSELLPEKENSNILNADSTKKIAPVTDTFSYYFITGFEDLEDESLKQKRELPSPTESNVVRALATPIDKDNLSTFYRLNFTPDQIVTQLDNSIINTPYLPYNLNDNYINPPALNGMFKLAISDMFKDYQLLGGLRLASNLRETDFFLQYHNVKKRMDKSLLFFRRAERTPEETTIRSSSSNEIRGILKWPFSEIASVRAHSFLREDRETYLSTNRAALERKPDVRYWVGGKAEYVYDNTLPDGINIMYGTRFKVYYEYFNNVVNQTTIHIIGGDFRHYLKIYKSLIWANRLAFARSMGKAKVVYFLGGVDNWMRLSYNSDVSVDEEINFAFKSLATNLRGWNQNIRNGASYAVWNSELRWPVVKTFTNHPIKSQFLENFQLIGFADVGTAFNGLSPFSEENSFNKRILNEGPLRIVVSTLREPIIGGYGFGLRSILLGYFVRVDWAWGYEKGIFPERMTYLSLGLDF